MKKNLLLLAVSFAILTNKAIAECEEGVTPIPSMPSLQLSVSGTTANASWRVASGVVEEYVLYYAPYSNPISGVTLQNIQNIDMGEATSISTDLPIGTYLYVAVTGINCSGESPFSNIAVLFIGSDTNGSTDGSGSTDSSGSNNSSGSADGSGTTDGSNTADGSGTIDSNEPAAVTAMRDKASTVGKNTQGYYEATFSNGMSFIYIPEGSFTMGSNSITELEQPAHQVTLSGYWIGKHEVTKGNFSAFVTANNFITDAEKAGAEGCYIYDTEELGFVPSPEGNWKNTLYPQTDSHPVACVSHNDANAYVAWLSTQLGVTVKLPTEAQWEKAARGTDQRTYPWGNTLPSGTLANYADITFANGYPDSNQGIPDLSVNDGYAATAPVGSYPAGASPYGALDMAGNVSEWVADWYADYTSSAKTNPTGPSSGDSKVNRGGNWVDSAGRQGQNPSEITDGHNILAAGRTSDDASSSDDHNGFRVAIE